MISFLFDLVSALYQFVMQQDFQMLQLLEEDHYYDENDDVTGFQKRVDAALKRSSSGSLIADL